MPLSKTRETDYILPVNGNEFKNYCLHALQQSHQKYHYIEWPSILLTIPLFRFIFSANLQKNIVHVICSFCHSGVQTR